LQYLFKVHNYHQVTIAKVHFLSQLLSIDVQSSGALPHFFDLKIVVKFTNSNGFKSKVRGVQKTVLSIFN